MAKDTRLFAKFALDFADHPKIAILSDKAFRCLVEAMLHSRERESDGLLARRYAVARWSLEVLQELCNNDDEKPSLVECEKGWLIHDYAEHQETKAEIHARRERNRIAGQKGGLAKGKRGAKRSAKRAASQPLSENVAETEIDNSLGTDVPREEPRKRGTRIPDGWIPADDTIAEMRTQCPNVDLKAEHAKFCDYWRAKAGKDATKLDWDATWRNWIRRAAEHQPARANGQAPAARKVGVGLELANRLGNQNPELTA